MAPLKAGVNKIYYKRSDDPQYIQQVEISSEFRKSTTNPELWGIHARSIGDAHGLFARRIFSNASSELIQKKLLFSAVILTRH